jgi:hypothetical protein
VAVFSGVGVLVGVSSGVGVNVAVFSGVGVLVGVSSGVGVNVAVFSGVGVLVGTLVGVGVFVHSGIVAGLYGTVAIRLHPTNKTSIPNKIFFIFPSFGKK